MVTSPSLLPPAPATQEMANAEAVLAPGGTNPEQGYDLRAMGWLFNTERCPAHLLETMLYAFGMQPLYWAGNPESVTRAIHGSLYTYDIETDEECGLFHHRGGECGLRLLSRVTQTYYNYVFRRDPTSGKKLGVTLYISNPDSSAIDYSAATGGQAYLSRAYGFMLGDRFVIDQIIFTESFDASIGVHAYAWQEGFTP